MNNNILLIQNKKEYIKQLKHSLIPCLYEGIYSIYIDSKKTYLKNIDTYIKKNYGILTIFQLYLKNILKWNNNIIDNECKRIEIKSKCNYYDKLIEAIIKSHVNIMIYNGNNNDKTNLKIEIPHKYTFIHQCYIEIAKIIYKNPYFMLDIDKSSKNTDKKIRKCKKIINESIDECIRHIIPIDIILNTYLSKNNTNTNNTNTNTNINNTNNTNTNNTNNTNTNINTNTTNNTNTNTNISNKSIIVEKYSNSNEKTNSYSE